jgi:probable addiction module antidote protein
MKPSVSFDETRKKILRDPRSAALYLEECLQDGDPALFTAALKYVAEARGGVASLSRKTRLNRETLYRTLSKRGNPRLDTLTKLLGAMGLRIGVVPVKKRR